MKPLKTCSHRALGWEGAKNSGFSRLHLVHVETSEQRADCTPRRAAAEKRAGRRTHSRQSTQDVLSAAVGGASAGVRSHLGRTRRGLPTSPEHAVSWGASCKARGAPGRGPPWLAGTAVTWTKQIEGGSRDRG
jgi:hypothetical protein